MQDIQIDPSDMEALPAELREQFPTVVRDLQNGVIDEVPEAVLNQLPAGVVDRIPESLLASNVNMTLVIVLSVIAAVAFAGFAYGVTKAAMKAALFFLVVGALAALLLFLEF